MAIVIIGRGIDLSAVAIMAMSVAWYLQMLNDGTRRQRRRCRWRLAACCSSASSTASSSPMPMCPAIFATLASGAFVFGYRALAADHARMRCRCRRGHWVETAGRAALPRHSGRGLHLRRRWPSWPSCSCASPNGAATSICMGDNPHGGAQHGHSGAPDDRAALCDLGADRASPPAS